MKIILTKCMNRVKMHVSTYNKIFARGNGNEYIKQRTCKKGR